MPPLARRLLCLVLAVTAVAGLLGAARVGWVATHPVTRDVPDAQLRHLDRALDGGAAVAMQRLFPEGFAFTHALVGLAASRPAAPGDTVALRRVSRALAALDSPAGRAPFTAVASPPNGAFWSGWSLLLAVEKARLSGIPADRRDVGRRAATLTAALVADGDGFLESYPGQVWPVDTVVAVAALARADGWGAAAAARPVVRGWTARTMPARDPGTGLLPHLLGPDGTVLAGPRGSSQALILAFEPDVDAARAAADYRRFAAGFVTRRFGLVGVREYPAGTRGRGDVDSGPLIAGISPSGSAVMLAAARRQRDTRLARALDAEAELVGMPFTARGARRYGLGLLPVGDAFLAWDRAEPPVDAGLAAGSDVATPGPLWWAWIAVLLAPALLLLGLIVGPRLGPGWARRPR